MGVKPGYKRTEVGVIPEEWEVIPLGAVAQFRTGPFGSALHKSDYTTDGIPVINPMHIIDGELSPSTQMSITEVAAQQLSEFRLKAGEVVLGRRGDMGRCALVQRQHEGWLCGTGSMIVRPGSAVDPGFLSRILSSPSVVASIEEASVGSTMINLNQGTLRSLLVQLPPVSEQRAIATALSDVDALLTQLDRLIAKKRDIKQAAMQQLLTGKTRLPGFDGAWRTGTVGDVVEALEAGVSVNSMDDPPTPGAPSVLKTSAVSAGRFLPEECKRITAADIPRARINPLANTILISRMNTPDLVGEVAYVPVDHPWLFLPDRLWMTRLKPGTRVDARWLAYLLSNRAYQQQIKASATGTSGSMKNISKDSLLNIPVPFPEHEEQTAIATLLSDLDAELAALEARRDKTRALKLGMMQELLTGRTRLV